MVEVRYHDSSPELTSEVLENLIKEYFRAHLQIHQSAPDSIMVMIELADQARSRLRATEEEISELKGLAGSMPDEPGKVSDLNTRIRDLEHRHQAEVEGYRFHQTNLEKLQIDDGAFHSLIPRIGLLQRPSSPLRQDHRGACMVALGIAAFGALAGLALALIPSWLIHRQELSSR